MSIWMIFRGAVRLAEDTSACSSIPTRTPPNHLVGEDAVRLNGELSR